MAQGASKVYEKQGYIILRVRNGFMSIAFGDDSTDANTIKALENLAKIKGLYKEEKTVTHQVIKIDVVEEQEKLEEPNDNVVPSGCVILEDDDE